MKTTLAPTIWRSCRVLASTRRLAILQVVIERGPVCVKEVAQICHLPENTATQYLRALQSRGLLAAHRQSRWVYYAPQADPAVQHAQPMLEAMRNAFAQGESRKAMVAALTAFTHPRRIAMVRQLAAGPASVPEVASAIGASRQAGYRQMEKLAERAVVILRMDERWELARPAAGLAHTLLQETLA